MVCMLITLLSGTCLPGYADAAGINFRKDTAVLYHALHTSIYCIPGGWRDSFDLQAFGFIFFLDCAIHLFYPVEQRKLVESSLICNCCNISCKLAGRVVICTLSNCWRNRRIIRNLWLCLRNLNTGSTSKSEFFRIFLQYIKSTVAGIIRRSCFSFCIVWLYLIQSILFQTQTVSDFIRRSCCRNAGLPVRRSDFHAHSDKPAFWIRCYFL